MKTYKIVVIGIERPTVYRSLIAAHKVAKNQAHKTVSGRVYIKDNKGVIVWRPPFLSGEALS